MNGINELKTCPRCNNVMTLLIQSEIGSREVKTTYMYMCIVCRYKEIVERVSVRKNGGKLLVNIYRDNVHS